MGSTESSEGRRVSFGMDEEERVRVLQGIRVSGPPAGATSEHGLGRRAAGAEAGPVREVRVGERAVSPVSPPDSLVASGCPSAV